MKASLHPIDQDALDAIWSAYQRGEIDGAEMTRQNDALYPRCPVHGKGQRLTVDGRPACEDCVQPGKHPPRYGRHV